MRTRSLIFLLGLAAIAAAAIVLYTRDTPERRIAARIEQLALALTTAPAQGADKHAARLDRVLEEAVTTDVVIMIPDFPELSRGRSGLAYIGKRALSDPRGLEVRAQVSELRLDPDENGATARVRSELGRPGDELHKDVRQVTLRFENADGEWRVASIEVAPKTHEEPEARP